MTSYQNVISVDYFLNNVELKNYQIKQILIIYTRICVRYGKNNRKN